MTNLIYLKLCGTLILCHSPSVQNQVVKSPRLMEINRTQTSCRLLLDDVVLENNGDLALYLSRGSNFELKNNTNIPTSFLIILTMSILVYPLLPLKRSGIPILGGSVLCVILPWTNCLIRLIKRNAIVNFTIYV